MSKRTLGPYLPPSAEKLCGSVRKEAPNCGHRVIVGVEQGYYVVGLLAL